MKKDLRKLKIINILLVIITTLTFVTSSIRAVNLDKSPVFRIIVNIAFLIIVIKYLFEYKKLGYILCLINGYSLVLFKLITIPLLPMVFSDFVFGSFYVLDCLILIAYLLLGHLGYSASRKIRT